MKVAGSGANKCRIGINWCVEIGERLGVDLSPLQQTMVEREPGVGNTRLLAACGVKNKLTIQRPPNNTIAQHNIEVGIDVSVLPNL